jgi:hypothetical protein
MDIKITLTQEQVAQIIRQQTKLFTRFRNILYHRSCKKTSNQQIQMNDKQWRNL